MKRVFIITIFILLMAVSSLAVAQGMQQGRGMGRNMPTFAEFDLDRNGYLDEDEFIEARGKRVSDRASQGRMMRGLSSMLQFSDLDLNADGKITPDEFTQGQVAHRQKKLQQ
jgi:hypothetical protein